MSRSHIEQLLSSYTIERHDDTSALVLAFTMVTAGFTYVIATTLYVNKNCHASGCSNFSWVQLVAPAIPVAVLGFLVLTTATTRMRSVHLQEIEAELQKLQSNDDDGIFRAPEFHTAAGVVWRPDGLWAKRFKDFAHLIFSIVNVVVYSIIFVVMIGFVISVLWEGPWTGGKVAAAYIYGTILFVEILGFWVALSDSRFKIGRAHV